MTSWPQGSADAVIMCSKSPKEAAKVYVGQQNNTLSSMYRVKAAQFLFNEQPLKFLRTRVKGQNDSIENSYQKKTANV